MLDISPAKMTLFGISRELPFGVCSPDEPCASSHTATKGEYVHRGRKSWVGYSKQRVHEFSLDESLTGKKRNLFFFLLGSAITAGPESFPFCSQLYLIEVSVYYYYFCSQM